MIIRILKSSGTSILEPRQISLLHSRLLLFDAAHSNLVSRDYRARVEFWGSKARPEERSTLRGNRNRGAGSRSVRSLLISDGIELSSSRPET